jgi:hypothetical protein
VERPLRQAAREPMILAFVVEGLKSIAITIAVAD